MSAAGSEARAAPRPGPALTLIRRRSRALIQRGAGRRLAPLALAAAIVVAALVVGVLLEQVVLAQSAFRVARIRRRITVAERRNQGLLLAMTRLERPARIKRVARTRLGMVDPTSVDYVVADVGPSDGRVARVAPSSPRPTAGQAAGLFEGAP